MERVVRVIFIIIAARPLEFLVAAVDATKVFHEIKGNVWIFVANVMRTGDLAGAASVRLISKADSVKSSVTYKYTGSLLTWKVSEGGI